MRGSFILPWLAWTATSIAAGLRCEQASAACVLAYIGRKLPVALQSGPNLRLEAAVRKHLGNQTQVTGLSCCQLLIEQQHLVGLQETDTVTALANANQR